MTRLARALLAGCLPVLASSPLLAHPAVSVVVDKGGTVYYSDTERVWTIAPDGTRRVAVPDVHTHELWLDDDGTLYGEHLWYDGEAANTWGHRVWKRAPNGAVSVVIPNRKGFLQDHRDFTFARDAQRHLYWVEGSRPARVMTRATPGASPEVLATMAFTNQSWLSVTRDGTCYVSEGGVVWRIRRGAAAERLPDALSRSRERLAVIGMAVGPDGALYVAAYEDGAVRRLSLSGQVTTVATTPRDWKPTGVAVAPDGALWVLEASSTNAQRVRRIAPDGSSRIF
jgi:DNA-binding beta-propeller fold protein YncE